MTRPHPRPVPAPSRSQISLRRLGGSRIGVLLGARIIEQGTLGLATLMLARWLGVDNFAPVAALLVFNSLAVVASDLGLGTTILGSAVHAVGRDQLRRLRSLNAVLCVVAVAVGLALGGTWRTALPVGGALWILSGEAFVHKCALLRLTGERRVAVVEIASSALFLAVTVLVAVVGDHGLLIVGAALVAKHLLEVLGTRGWGAALGRHGRPGPGAVWWTQVLAYLIANVDFLVVGAVVSAAAFSVYSLGFRVASLITSQISYAMGRVIMVELAEAGSTVRRQRVYDRRVRLLFVTGAVAGVMTAAVAAALPWVLGDGWERSALVVAVLAVATPWRMMLGMSGALMIAEGKAPVLMRWEVGRLVVTALALVIAAQGGLWAFTGAVAVVVIIMTVMYDRLASSASGLRTWRLPALLGLPGVVLAVGAAQLISGR